jgi:hypothetical protein
LFQQARLRRSAETCRAGFQEKKASGPAHENYRNRSRQEPSHSLHLLPHFIARTIVEESLGRKGGDESKAFKARDSMSVRITGTALDANPSTIIGMLNSGTSVDIAGDIAILEEQHLL